MMLASHMLNELIPVCPGCSVPFDMAHSSPQILPCAHSFCLRCVRHEFAVCGGRRGSKRRCPICQKKYSSYQLNLVFAEALERIRLRREALETQSRACEECDERGFFGCMRRCLTCETETAAIVGQHAASLLQSCIVCLECCVNRHNGHSLAPLSASHYLSRQQGADRGRHSVRTQVCLSPSESPRQGSSSSTGSLFPTPPSSTNLASHFGGKLLSSLLSRSAVREGQALPPSSPVSTHTLSPHYLTPNMRGRPNVREQTPPGVRERFRIVREECSPFYELSQCPVQSSQSNDELKIDTVPCSPEKDLQDERRRSCSSPVWRESGRESSRPPPPSPSAIPNMPRRDPLIRGGPSHLADSPHEWQKRLSEPVYSRLLLPHTSEPTVLSASPSYINLPLPLADLSSSHNTADVSVCSAYDYIRP